MDNDSNDDDDALWHYVTRDVEPLDKNNKTKAINTQTFQQSQKQKPGTPRPKQTETHPPTTTAQGHEIDRRTAQKLGRGQMPIDARLDLHGMNQPQAHSALTRFIQNAYNTGQRHVLIITGKGRTKSKDAQEYGVLRKNVPYWLKESSIAHLILETKTARKEHGGEGALSILIRRNRSL